MNRERFWTSKLLPRLVDTRTLNGDQSNWVYQSSSESGHRELRLLPIRESLSKSSTGRKNNSISFPKTRLEVEMGTAIGVTVSTSQTIPRRQILTLKVPGAM